MSYGASCPQVRPQRPASASGNWENLILSTYYTVTCRGTVSILEGRRLHPRESDSSFERFVAFRRMHQGNACNRASCHACHILCDRSRRSVAWVSTSGAMASRQCPGNHSFSPRFLHAASLQCGLSTAARRLHAQDADQKRSWHNPACACSRFFLRVVVHHVKREGIAVVHSE